MNRGDSLFRRLDATGVPLVVMRLIVGGLFVWMGVVKVKDPINFLKLIHLYDMLPESPAYFLNGTAIILPWLEVLIGLSLLLGVLVRGASVTTAVMLAVFTPAIALRALAIQAAEGTPFFDIAFDCGCGAGVVVTWHKLLENTTLFLLALYGVFSMSRRFCLSQWLDRRRPRPGYCRHCGYSLHGAGGDLCRKCQSRDVLAQATPDVA